jgi:sn-glycerol 3-phosphate transport system ATP-binding protein
MADVSIRNVKKSYGKTEVVHGVSLDIPDGTFVAILGPSGCGKSTVLRMIAGLEAISAGEIAIGGAVVNKLEPRERGCAMVFQNYALYPHMTVAENIGYALKVAGMPKTERRQRVEDAVRTVELSEFLDRRPGQLSGGQRQRVAMARAIVRNPKVFLFDEPLSNLDAKLRAAMRLEIRRLHNRLKATSVFVTHDQAEALTLADLVVVMNAGRIEQIATPRDLYRFPASRFVAGFIGSPPMNLMSGIVVRDGAAVDIEGGGRLSIDAEAFGLQPGRVVEVGVRPEDVILDGARHDAADSAASALAFTAELTEELGAVRLIYGKSGARDFAVSMPVSAQPLLNGQSARVHAHPAGVHLFDPQSGQSLRTAMAKPALALAAQ